MRLRRIWAVAVALAAGCTLVHDPDRFVGSGPDPDGGARDAADMDAAHEDGGSPPDGGGTDAGADGAVGDASSGMDASTSDGGSGVDAGSSDAGPTCVDGEMACGGVCIDPMDDEAHCGGCDNACGLGGTCLSGVCDGVAGLAAGAAHTCLWRTGGKVVCWGDNGFGQLGTGSTTPGHSGPVEVVGLADVRGVAAGYNHTCAVRSDRSAWCWGFNGNGQLGDGTNAQRLTPTLVAGGSAFVAIGAGNSFTCGLTEGSTVACWGFNNRGQLGNGSTTDANAPQHVSVPGLPVELAVGASHACARKSDDTVSCWGSSYYGELGNGSSGGSFDAGSTVPVSVTGIDDALEVAAGGQFTCARRAGGSIWCWGNNLFYRLGDGTEVNRSEPVASVAFTAPLQLSLGGAHACARGGTGGGQVKCWGYNMEGQLGDGSTLERTAGAFVSGLSDASSIAAGGSHSCAARATGDIVCWGNNGGYQLGDGTMTHASAPVTVVGFP